MFLIGIGNQTKSTAFSLLAHETIGYTLVPISGYSYYTSTTGVKSAGFLATTDYEGIYYSINGRDWVKGNVPAELKAPGYEAALYTEPLYVNEKYFTIMQNGQVGYSTDGINWKAGDNINTKFGINESWSFGKIGFVKNNNVVPNGLFTHMSWHGRVIYSTDGITWNLGPDYSNLNDTWSNGLTHYPYAGQIFAISDSGYNIHSYGNYNIENYDINGNKLSGNFTIKPSIGGNSQKVVAVSTTGAVYSSQYGGWSLQSQLPHSTGIYYLPPVYDGTNWYIAEAQTTDSHQYYYVSSDLVNWTQIENTKDSYQALFLDDANRVICIGTTITNHLTNSQVYFELSTYNRAFSLYATSNLGTIMTGINSRFNAFKEKNSDYWIYSTTLGPYPPIRHIVGAQINTLKEIQISIGGQGSDGTAETLVPVAVYTVPTGKTAKITEIKVNNLHSSAITYDLGKLSSGQTLTQAHSIKWDTALAGNSSDTITQVINMVAGDTITILPSSVNTVSVAIYGAESNA